MKKTSGQFVIYIISSWMRCEAVFRFVVFQLIVYIFHGCGIQDAQSNRSVSIWFLSTTIAIGMTMTNWRHMQLPNIYTHFVQLYMEFSKMLDNFVDHCNFKTDNCLRYRKCNKQLNKLFLHRVQFSTQKCTLLISIIRVQFRFCFMNSVGNVGLYKTTNSNQTFEKERL